MKLFVLYLLACLIGGYLLRSASDRSRVLLLMFASAFICFEYYFAGRI